MFVGHYSVAFACRTERNRIPLWVLFIAVQFLDYIWATLVLVGIEKLRVIKGFYGRQHARFVFSPVFTQFDHGSDLERHRGAHLPGSVQPTPIRLRSGQA
jgi:hypothetical protein